MNNTKMSQKDLVKELNITKNKTEFINDLNLFLNLSAFDSSENNYYNAVKKKIRHHMDGWELNIEDNFSIVHKYIKSNKLPYKIGKNEGFENIKNDRFILSVLIEIYAINIISNNDELTKKRLVDFIHSEFENNKIELKYKDIMFLDLEYLFKDRKTILKFKQTTLNLKEEIQDSFDIIKDIFEKRNKIELKLNYKLDSFEKEEIIANKIDIQKEIIELKKDITRLKEEVNYKDKLIEKYKNNQLELIEKINNVKKGDINTEEYRDEQASKVIIDFVKNMNNDINGNILDRLYCYSKGKEEKNLMFITNNLFNVLRQMGVYPRETIKIGDTVSIEEYSFYNYRLNKDISDIKLSEGKVVYPAWFYKNKEILKPFVDVKGE